MNDISNYFQISFGDDGDYWVNEAKRKVLSYLGFPETAELFEQIRFYRREEALAFAHLTFTLHHSSQNRIDTDTHRYLQTSFIDGEAGVLLVLPFEWRTRTTKKIQKSIEVEGEVFTREVEGPPEYGPWIACQEVLRIYIVKAKLYVLSELGLPDVGWKKPKVSDPCALDPSGKHDFGPYWNPPLPCAHCGLAKS